MKWKNYAIRVIKTDCMTCGEYKNAHGTCAIAALAEAAGCKLPKDLGNQNSTGVGDGPPRNSWVWRAIRAIERKFGLSREDQIDIQTANDSVDGHSRDDVRRRRRAVLEVIKEL